MLNALSKIEKYTRGLSPQNKQILPDFTPQFPFNRDENFTVAEKISIF